jgi:YVTN family beta-propeller protein
LSSDSVSGERAVSLQFLILGPLEVREGQRLVRLGSAKQRALLGVLLLHANGTVSVSSLVDELWGERPPATAEKLVQGYVHALRKQLGTEILKTRPGGYLLDIGPHSLDVAEFERLREAASTAPPPQAFELRRRALALWRGVPLGDVPLEGPARHTVARLAELRLATQIEQFDAELERGNHAQLVGELEALAAEHPYQERVAALFMLALYRAGRPADALAFYRALRRRLSDELALEPGQELRALEGRILRQDPTLALPPLAPAGAAVSTPAETTEPPAQRRLVRRSTAVAAVVGAGVAAIGVAFALLTRADAARPDVAPNTVALIDPATNGVDGTIAVGIRPGEVAWGAGSLWVANLDDRTVTRIDPRTRGVVRTISLSAAPDALAVGAGAVWVVNGRLGSLHRIDPEFNSVSEPIVLAGRATYSVDGGVDVAGRHVWAVFADSTLARVDGGSLSAVTARVAGTSPASLVAAFDAVWVSTGDPRRGVQRFGPQTFRQGAIDQLAIGRTPAGLAAGAGSLWVANTDEDTVTRIDPAGAGFNPSIPIEVGDGPTAVAVGAGGVWVANTAAGTISRIDPATNEVEATIDVGNAPTGVAVGEGMVAVAVQAP